MHMLKSQQILWISWRAIQIRDSSAYAVWHKAIQPKKWRENVPATREVSVFYLFRHLTSKTADLARLGGELGGKLRGQVHLTVCRDIWMVIFWGGSLQIYLNCTKFYEKLKMNVLIVTGFFLGDTTMK